MHLSPDMLLLLSATQSTYKTLFLLENIFRSLFKHLCQQKIKGWSNYKYEEEHQQIRVMVVVLDPYKSTWFAGSSDLVMIREPVWALVWLCNSHLLRFKSNCSQNKFSHHHCNWSRAKCLVLFRSQKESNRIHNDLFLWFLVPKFDVKHFLQIWQILCIPIGESLQTNKSAFC